ncbi:MAG: hypothetical protein JXA89_16015 [Anaerolineae bacterium]|nr:hypothetical protein [Anaerolineae bacterium]
MMNDDFLVRYRQHPRPEFVESLYKRISPEPRHSISFAPMNKLVQNMTLMGVTLFLMYTCSSGVRGRLLNQIARIG